MDLTTASANVAASPALLPARASRARRRLPCNARMAGRSQPLSRGENDERLFAVAAWREAPYFDDAERAALALTEAATRISDRAEPVPDEVWGGQNCCSIPLDPRGFWTYRRGRVLFALVASWSLGFEASWLNRTARPTGTRRYSLSRALRKRVTTG